MTDAEATEDRAQLGAIRRCGVIEGGAKATVAGVDAQGPAGLGVDEGQLADIDECVLARVGHLEGDDRVAAGYLGERRGPVTGAAKVGDHHHHAGGAADRADQG